MDFGFRISDFLFRRRRQFHLHPTSEIRNLKSLLPTSDIRHLKSLFLPLALVFLVQGEETAHWRLQYFYDEPRATFVIADLKFPSPKRGIAVGAIAPRGHVKPISALTSDGGEPPAPAPLKDPREPVYVLYHIPVGLDT